MSRSSVFRAVAHCLRALSLVVFDLVRLAFLAAHSRNVLAAENLFLRKQLALFQERWKYRRAEVRCASFRFHPSGTGWSRER